MQPPVDDIHLTCSPSAALAGFVTRYTGYRMTSAQPGVHRGLPSPTATVIITIDEPICLLGRHDAGERTFDALVGGLHDWPELVAYGHVQEGVQIDVTPLGVRALFGMPIGDVRGDSFELADVIGRRATRLSERLRDTQCWQTRFAICDQALSSWASMPRGVDLAALRALELMTAGHGNLPVERLADDVGFSRQHLTRRVRNELGLSPKRLAQLIRFDRARRQSRAV
jgi:AraC-like DNA-binding protein